MDLLIIENLFIFDVNTHPLDNFWKEWCAIRAGLFPFLVVVWPRGPPWLFFWERRLKSSSDCSSSESTSPFSTSQDSSSFSGALLTTSSCLSEKRVHSTDRVCFQLTSFSNLCRRTKHLWSCVDSVAPLLVFLFLRVHYSANNSTLKHSMSSIVTEFLWSASFIFVILCLTWSMHLTLSVGPVRVFTASRRAFGAHLKIF